MTMSVRGILLLGALGFAVVFLLAGLLGDQWLRGLLLGTIVAGTCVALGFADRSGRPQLFKEMVRMNSRRGVTLFFVVTFIISLACWTVVGGSPSLGLVVTASGAATITYFSWWTITGGTAGRDSGRRRR